MTDTPMHDQEPDAPTQGEGEQGDTQAVRAYAAEVKAALDSWQERIVQAVQSGRGATSAARMATARSAAELRRITLPEPPASEEGTGASLYALAEEYARRAGATVSQAAHEIERNRYTVTAMDRQLEKLSELYKQINP